MNYPHAGNGRHGGGPAPPYQSWAPPPQAQQPSGSKLMDLTKGGLSITLVASALYVALTVGVAVGSYQERATQMAAQLAELKADMRAVKEQLPDIRAMLVQIRDRPAPPPPWRLEVQTQR